MKRKWKENEWKWKENEKKTKENEIKMEEPQKNKTRPRCPEAPNLYLNPFEKPWSEQVLWWVAHKGGGPLN